MRDAGGFFVQELAPEPALNPPGRARIVFPCSTPLSYAVVAPVARALAADPRVEVVVTARHGGRREAERCLGFSFRYRNALVARFMRADAAVCAGYYFRAPRVRKWVEVFHGVSAKNYAVRSDAVRFSHLFLIGDYHRAKFTRCGLLAEGDPRGLSIGMPKTDPLAAGPPDRAWVGELGLDAARPTVAYAPTRSGDAGSSLDRGGIEAIDTLAALPVNVVVKLHDRSLRRYRSEVKDDFEAAVRAREARGNVRLYTGHDVVPLLRAADLLVSDLSSVANEFLLCDRPVVYLATPEHEAKVRAAAARRFGADDPENLDWLRRAGETVDGGAALAAAVERGLANPKARGAERRERALRLFYNPGRATAAAVAALYPILELDSP